MNCRSRLRPSIPGTPREEFTDWCPPPENIGANPETQWSWRVSQKLLRAIDGLRVTRSILDIVHLALVQLIESLQIDPCHVAGARMRVAKDRLKHRSHPVAKFLFIVEFAHDVTDDILGVGPAGRGIGGGSFRQRIRNGCQ